MDYLPITVDIIGYALLLITIYCCYEAYYKIKKNKGYIYIAIVCFLLLVPGILKVTAPLLASKTEQAEDTRRTTNTEINSKHENRLMSIEIPLVEIFLLLALLKFSFKEEKKNPNQEASGNPASPSSRA